MAFCYRRLNRLIQTLLRCPRAKLDFRAKIFWFLPLPHGYDWAGETLLLSTFTDNHFSRVKRVIWFNLDDKDLHGPNTRDQQGNRSWEAPVTMLRV